VKNKRKGLNGSTAFTEDHPEVVTGLQSALQSGQAVPDACDYAFTSSGLTTTSAATSNRE
jgi:hypothetical protein